MVPAFRARLLWAGLALAASFAAGADTSYVHRELKFGFTPPHGWARKKPMDVSGVVVVFVEPAAAVRPFARSGQESDEEFLARLRRSQNAQTAKSEGFQANLAVMARAASNLSLKEYARETRAKAARLTAYRILGEAPRKLGGVPAIERIIRLSPPGELAVQTREVICIHEGRIFTLTLAALPATFKKYSAEFDKTLHSFTWQK